MRSLLIAAAAALTAAGIWVAGPASAAVCTEQLGGNCGPYSYSAIPMSNGYDTYVSDQPVNPQAGTTSTVNASDPGNWTATVNAQPYGFTGVQMYVHVQQLTNDWNGDGTGWGGGFPDQDTPIDALGSLAVNYAEISPAGTSNIYQMAPDVWLNPYAGQLGPGTGDIMFWVDTTQTRCHNNGLNSLDILGTAAFGGQDWTFYRYGPAGGEIVAILDTTDHDPVANSTCARQKSGTIDILAGLNWLSSHGFLNGPQTMSQLNSGFEITSADHATFGFTSYGITATVAGSPSPSPSPSPTPTRTCKPHHRHCPV